MISCRSIADHFCNNSYDIYLFTSWGTRRCPGKIQPNLSKCMKNLYSLREYVENPDQIRSSLGVPPCKLFVDSLEKWMVFDRNKAQNKTKRSTISLSQSLLIEKMTTTTCTAYCSNDAEFCFLPKKREADKFLYHWSFSAIKEVYFYGAMGDRQPFKPDKLFLRNLPLKTPPRNLFSRDSICTWYGSPGRATCSLVMFRAR